jgi:fluoride ion exporter CrcB/FEX
MPNFAQTLALMIPISAFVALIIFLVYSRDMVKDPLDWSFAWAVLIVGMSSCGTLFAISLSKRRHRATAVVVMYVCGVLGGFTVGELIRGSKG